MRMISLLLHSAVQGGVKLFLTPQPGAAVAAKCCLVLGSVKALFFVLVAMLLTKNIKCKMTF